MKLSPDFMRFRFSSLAFKATASAFVLSLALMSAGGFYTVSKVHELGQENLEREAGNSAQILAHTIARPMWDIDTSGVMNNLASLKNSAIFCGARAIDDDGRIMADMGYPLSLDKRQSIFSQPVLFDDPTDDTDGLKTIGKLDLCVTSARLDAQMGTIKGRLVNSYGFVAIGIILSVYLSLQIVLRPLRRFKDAMGRFQTTMKPVSDPALLRDDEVGELVKSFNIMAASLAESYRALKKAKEETDESYRVKTDFFANMSHELRTPLNSILGMAQLLEGSKLDAEQTDMFDSIRRSAQTLLKIVNDILEISKIEAHHISLERISFDAYREIKLAVQALQPLAAQKNLVLNVETIGESLPVVGDPLRFSRILNNLVGNAIRYTERGHVTVYARAQKTREERTSLTVEVEDTGIGIPAEKLDHIFEKFTQADTSTTRKYGGTGLGLAITRELVEMMDGRIFVTSAPGKGSVFTFAIPFDTARPEDVRQPFRPDVFTDAPAGEMKGIPAEQARILIAEDHIMNQSFMRKLCKNLGISHYTMVENGREAVGEINMGSYDLVLMDCHMPEMNGYDATVAIPNNDDPIKRGIPIVAMTANAMPEDEQRCLACGMNAYISKPIDIPAFKRKLSPWLMFKATGAQTQASSLSALETIATAADISPVNLENLRANAMGDTGFIRDMAEMFVTQGSKQIDRLKALAGEGKSQEWTEVAHALKGTAGSMGAEKMRQLCARAQEAENTGQRRDMLRQIVDEYTRVRQYLADSNLLA